MCCGRPDSCCRLRYHWMFELLFPGCPSPQAGGSPVELYAGIEERAHGMLEVGDALKLQPKDFADRVIIALAGIMGNIWMVIAFCAAMITWVALGPK